MLLLLGACQEEEEVVQKEEVQLPTLEEMEVALIAEESLNGWDAGFNYKGGYCVGKRDTINGTSTLYINYHGGEAKEGMTLIFNEYDELVNIFFNEYYYSLQEVDGYIILNQMDSDGNFIASRNWETEKTGTRNVAGAVSNVAKLSWKAIASCLKKVQDKKVFNFRSTKYMNKEEINIEKMKYEIGGGFIDMIQIPGDTQESAINKLDLALLGTFTIAGLAATASLPVTATLVIGSAVIDISQNVYYYNAKKDIYGSANVSIINVSNDNSGNYILTVDISGINSIPPKYKEFLINYDNTVYCGVVANSSNELAPPSYYCCQGIASNSVPVTPSTSRRIYTMRGITGDPNDIIFRPYLITEREYKTGTWSMGRGKYIKYGESVRYKKNSSSIYRNNTTAAEYETGTIVFKGDVEIFNWCSKEEQWGLYINLDNGLKGRFPIQNQNTSITSVQFTVPIDDDNLYLNYDKWTATYKKEIGVYHINEKGEYTYGAMDECEFVYYEKPNIKFTYAEIIGTREEKNENGSRAVPNPDDEWKDDDDGDDDDGDDDDGDDDDKKTFITEFTQTFDVKGSLWIDRLDYVKDEGAPKFEVESGRPLKDGTYTKKGTIKYTAKMPNLSAITRYSITLKDGSQASYLGGYYSNRLYWSGENKITDVDWE